VNDLSKSCERGERRTVYKSASCSFLGNNVLFWNYILIYLFLCDCICVKMFILERLIDGNSGHCLS
jgi:hypothetical protein